MDKLFTLKFFFRGKAENGFVKVKLHEDCREFIVTVLNGDLERLLFGHNSFTERDGNVQIDLPSQNSDLARLKCAIGYALGTHLREETASLKAEDQH